MTRQAGLIGLGAAAALVAGIGIYFAARPSTTGPCLPRSRNEILDRARAQGVINCYRGALTSRSSWQYVADGGEVMVRFLGAGGSSNAGVFRINYRASATRKAGAMARVIHEVFAHPRVALAPAGVFP